MRDEHGNGNTLIDDDWTGVEEFDEATGEWKPVAPYVEGSTDHLTGDDWGDPAPANLIKTGDTDWWSAYKAKRDQKDGQATLWGEGRGAGSKGLTSWVGSGNYSYGSWYSGGATYGGYNDAQKLAVALHRALKFSRDMAEMAGREHVKGVGWEVEGAADRFNRLGTGLNNVVQLNPAPVRELVDQKNKAVTDQLAVNDIVAGQALHDGAHARHTPPGALQEYQDIAELPGLGQVATRQETATLGYLVEDAFVEASVLREYPGFQDYLDAQWAYLSPPAAMAELLREMHTEGGWTKKNTVKAIQDLSRRYTDFTPDEVAQYTSLPEDHQKFLGVGRRILDRAHDPSLDLRARVKLATDLARLILKGEVPPEDQQEAGTDKLEEGEGYPGQLGEGLKEEQGTGRFHDGQSGNSQTGAGTGQDAQGLNEQENQEAKSEADRDREATSNKWPNPPDGAHETEVIWLTPDRDESTYYNDTEGRRNYGNRGAMRTPRTQYPVDLAAVQPHVRQLARALHLRANRPSRQIGAQIRGKLDGRRLATMIATQHLPGPKRIFMRREVLEAPEAGVTLLIDVSGSTSADNRAGAFRRSAIMLDAALRELARDARGSVEWQAFSHTNTTSLDGQRHATLINRLRDPAKGVVDPSYLATINPNGGNFDGEALLAVCQKIERDWPDREKLVFFFNDGLPNGQDYGGEEAERRVKYVCDEYRKRGIKITTLYVGPLQQGGYRHKTTEASLTTMYGPQDQGWYHVPNVSDLPHVIGRLVRKQLQWKA